MRAVCKGLLDISVILGSVVVLLINIYLNEGGLMMSCFLLLKNVHIYGSCELLHYMTRTCSVLQTCNSEREEAHTGHSQREEAQREQVCYYASVSGH